MIAWLSASSPTDEGPDKDHGKRALPRIILTSILANNSLNIWPSGLSWSGTIPGATSGCVAELAGQKVEELLDEQKVHHLPQSNAWPAGPEASRSNGRVLKFWGHPPCADVVGG